jgi:hypothetical protein
MRRFRKICLLGRHELIPRLEALSVSLAQEESSTVSALIAREQEQEHNGIAVHLDWEQESGQCDGEMCFQQHNYRVPLCLCSLPVAKNEVESTRYGNIQKPQKRNLAESGFDPPSSGL